MNIITICLIYIVYATILSSGEKTHSCHVFPSQKCERHDLSVYKASHTSVSKPAAINKLIKNYNTDIINHSQSIHFKCTFLSFSMGSNV